MITVQFKRDIKSKILIGYNVDGHAEYQDGDTMVYDDLVCGVVSNLAQVTIIGVTEVLGIDASYVAEEGDIRLDISELSIEAISSCQVLLETMLLGLQRLEITYSEYIKVFIEEVR
ncbi:ribosomal-processing cysteine protease Prp [Clostridium sp. 19966]|uniref:ribosomal-processing cysteine protease Prp n=1 Tax=Clostridium sp. 19966 TaxID=2768166 RepID=UPI0028DF9EE6|nr:ribosomal-processing cysteine protease Prp [Clostridium sp. 19966]MDT8715286.1 ribosomal-processing cysteine protease Prp [Clostridium sp. 19966]